MLTWFGSSKHTFWLCRKQIRNICPPPKASSAACGGSIDYRELLHTLKALGNACFCLLLDNQTCMKSSLLLFLCMSVMTYLLQPGWMWGICHCTFSSDSAVLGRSCISGFLLHATFHGSLGHIWYFSTAFWYLWRKALLKYNDMFVIY